MFWTCYCYEECNFLNFSQIWYEVAGEDVSNKELLGVDDIGFPREPTLRTLSSARGGGQKCQALEDSAGE